MSGKVESATGCLVGCWPLPGFLLLLLGVCMLGFLVPVALFCLCGASEPPVSRMIDAVGVTVRLAVLSRLFQSLWESRDRHVDGVRSMVALMK